MVITKPIGILFENGQKLDEVDMEKKTFYQTSIVQSFKKNAPLTPPYPLTLGRSGPKLLSIFFLM